MLVADHGNSLTVLKSARRSSTGEMKHARTAVNDARYRGTKVVAVGTPTLGGFKNGRTNILHHQILCPCHPR